MIAMLRLSNIRVKLEKKPVKLTVFKFNLPYNLDVYRTPNFLKFLSLFIFIYKMYIGRGFFLVLEESILTA